MGKLRVNKRRNTTCDEKRNKRKKGMIDSDGGGGVSYKLSKSDEESGDEKNIGRLPVERMTFSDFVDPKVYGDYPVNEPESDEEVYGDNSRRRGGEFNFAIKRRVEIDKGCKYVVKDRWNTVTNPKVPLKIYFKSDGSEGTFISPVLRCPQYPLAAISKLALKTYNTIQDTNYQYVGLVKAYVRTTIYGFSFTTRFKARIHGQDAINFQAKIIQPRQDMGTSVAPVQIESVYPLPPRSIHGQDAINFQAKIIQPRQDMGTSVAPVQIESVYPLPPSCAP